MNYNLNPIKGGQRDKLNSQIQNVAISTLQMIQLLQQINGIFLKTGDAIKRCISTRGGRWGS